MATRPTEPYVFLSYARADSLWAERLERDLLAQGVATWRDRRDIDPSQDFTGEIERAIRGASHVLACLTPAVKERGDSFVRRELAYALAHDASRRAGQPPRRLRRHRHQTARTWRDRAAAARGLPRFMTILRPATSARCGSRSLQIRI